MEETGHYSASNPNSANFYCNQRKSRKKRKDLNALVGEEKIRKSSSLRRDLLGSDSDDLEFDIKTPRQKLFTRGCALAVGGIFLLATTIVVVITAVRVLIGVQEDLSSIMKKINACELMNTVSYEH